MIFNGDLSRYHPADAIMFLSQLNLDGVFSIVDDQRVIALSFKNGSIVDAHSRRGDAKILQALLFHLEASADQVRHIRRIQAETGMPIRAILSQLDLFPLSKVTDSLLTGMHEVLLEMFLLERGAFNFADTPVETDDADTRLEASTQAIRVTAQSDEYRDFEKNLVSLDRAYTVDAAATATTIKPPLTNEKVILYLTSGCQSIGQLIEKSPMDSHTAMETVRALIEKGTLVPAPLTERSSTDDEMPSAAHLFRAFRQTMNTLLRVQNPFKRLEALVAYCKQFYDDMLVFTAKDDQLVYCEAFHRAHHRGFVQKSHKGPLGQVSTDAVLTAVHHSGVAFFGESFASRLIASLAGKPSGGECALIPIATRGAVALYLYVFSRKKFSGISPQHYLEQLSWMVVANRRSPDQQDTAPMKAPEKIMPAKSSGISVSERMVSMVDDLPPLPTLISRALELLADPDTSAKEIEAVIEKDQSLVSKLIRVSNSTLYGGMQRVESLQQAITRLGARTSRGLIVAASMQTFFLRASASVRALGHELWQHTAECGLAARRIATTIGYDNPEKAFVGGVLHDIGKVVILLTGGDAYHDILSLMRDRSLGSLDAEKRIIGTDHVAIGIQLMDKWKMPTSASLCVAYHHHPEKADNDRPLATIVAYANQLSHCHGAHSPINETMQAQLDTLSAGLGISPNRQGALLSSVTEDFQSSGLF